MMMEDHMTHYCNLWLTCTYSPAHELLSTRIFREYSRIFANIREWKKKKKKKKNIFFFFFFFFMFYLIKVQSQDLQTIKRDRHE